MAMPAPLSAGLQSLSVGVQHDQAFQEIDDSLQPYLEKLRKGERIRAVAWLVKMRELTNNLTWKRQRNQYARLMLSQLEAGCFEAPFDVLPPSSGLPTLQPHLMYRFISSSARYSSPPLRQTPMKLKSRPQLACPAPGTFSAVDQACDTVPARATPHANTCYTASDFIGFPVQRKQAGAAAIEPDVQRDVHNPAAQQYTTTAGHKPGAAATAHLQSVMERFEQRRTQWAVDAAREGNAAGPTSRPDTAPHADTGLDAEASLMHQLDQELEAMRPLTTPEVSAGINRTPRTAIRSSKVPVGSIFTDLPTSCTTPSRQHTSSAQLQSQSQQVPPSSASDLKAPKEQGAGWQGAGPKEWSSSPPATRGVSPPRGTASVVKHVPGASTPVATPGATLPAPGQPAKTPGKTPRHTPGCTNLEELLLELQLEDGEGEHDTRELHRRAQTAPVHGKKTAAAEQPRHWPKATTPSPSASPELPLYGHASGHRSVSLSQYADASPMEVRGAARSASQPRGSQPRDTFTDVSGSKTTARRSVSPVVRHSGARRSQSPVSRTWAVPTKPTPPRTANPRTGPSCRQTKRTPGGTPVNSQSVKPFGSLAQQLSPILDAAVSPAKPSTSPARTPATATRTQSPPGTRSTPAMRSPEHMARSPALTRATSPALVSPRARQISPRYPRSREGSPGAEDLQQHEAVLQQQLQAVQAAQALQSAAVSAAVDSVRRSSSAFMLVLQHALPTLHAAVDAQQEGMLASGAQGSTPTKHRAVRVLNVAVAGIRASVAEVEGAMDKCEGVFRAEAGTATTPPKSPAGSPSGGSPGADAPPWRHAGRALARSPPPRRRSPSPARSPPWVDAQRQAAAVCEMSRAAEGFSQALAQLEHAVQQVILKPLVTQADAGNMAASQALSASAHQLSAAGRAAHIAASVAQAYQQLSGAGQDMEDELKRSEGLLAQVVEPGTYGTFGVSSPRGPKAPTASTAAGSSPGQKRFTSPRDSPGHNTRNSSSVQGPAGVPGSGGSNVQGYGSPGGHAYPGSTRGMSGSVAVVSRHVEGGGTGQHHSTTSVNARMPVLSSDARGRAGTTGMSRVGSTAPSTPSQRRMLPPDVMALLRQASEDGIHWQAALKVAADRVEAAHAHARAAVTHNQTSVLVTHHEPLLPLSLMNDLSTSPAGAYVSPGRKQAARDQTRRSHAPAAPPARVALPVKSPGRNALSLLPPDLLADVLSDQDVVARAPSAPARAARDFSPATRHDLIPSSPDIPTYKRTSLGIVPRKGPDQLPSAYSPGAHMPDRVLGGVGDWSSYATGPAASKAAYTPSKLFNQSIFHDLVPGGAITQAGGAQYSPGSKAGGGIPYHQASPVAKVIVHDLNAEYRQAMHQVRAAETDNRRQLEAFKTAKRSLAITDLPPGLGFGL